MANDTRVRVLYQCACDASIDTGRLIAMPAAEGKALVVPFFKDISGERPGPFFLENTDDILA
jgi:hypothetical protein